MENTLRPGDVVTANDSVRLQRGSIMGDNRDSSADSRAHRSVANGTVPESDVIGVVTRILKPAKRARLLPQH